MSNYQLPILTQELTKTEIKSMADKCVEQISENGYVINAIDMLAKMELLTKEIRSSKLFIDLCLTEISKYGKELTTSTGTKIELMEAGVKYDFSKCNDEILDEMQKQADELETKIKERKEFLKKLPVEGLDVISMHGEMQRIYRPSKSSTSTYKATISK